MLLDVDHYDQGRHVQGFVNAIAEARRQRVNLALSKPCFELWLLLHHVDEAGVKELKGAKEVEEALRAVIGEYNKTNLKQAHYPITSVRDACARAARLDQEVAGGDVPAANTARVFKVWKAIAAKALPSQLPDELRTLFP